eukprot:gene9881-52_t
MAAENQIMANIGKSIGKVLGQTQFGVHSVSHSKSRMASICGQSLEMTRRRLPAGRLLGQMD